MFVFVMTLSFYRCVTNENNERLCSESFKNGFFRQTDFDEYMGIRIML